MVNKVKLFLIKKKKVVCNRHIEKHTVRVTGGLSAAPVRAGGWQAVICSCFLTSVLEKVPPYPLQSHPVVKEHPLATASRKQPPTVAGELRRVPTSDWHNSEQIYSSVHWAVEMLSG